MSQATHIKRLLSRLRRGRISVDEALTQLRDLPYEDLAFAKVDHHRVLRTGLPEVIFAQGKQPAQIATIATRLMQHARPVFITKLEPQVFRAIQPSVNGLRYHETARMAYSAPRRKAKRRTKANQILIVTAGTADIPVAEEAKLTLKVLAHPVKTLYDVGVAGIHRLLDHRAALRRAKTIIVVAGMEGALPSVIGGLVSCPVIAVPTSVGYGAHFKGIAPLLTMLNTCAPGVAVVNIDNGFGAGVLAHRILNSS